MFRLKVTTRPNLHKEGHWRYDANLDDRETLFKLAHGAGIDPEPLLAAAMLEQTQAIYESNTQEAIERSVFNSPTYFVDGDIFYGQDYLEMVERAPLQPFVGDWPIAVEREEKYQSIGFVS